jgi:hypothetical protein
MAVKAWLDPQQTDPHVALDLIRDHKQTEFEIFPQSFLAPGEKEIMPRETGVEAETPQFQRPRARRTIRSGGCSIEISDFAAGRSASFGVEARARQSLK